MKKTLISFCSILLVFMAATSLCAGGPKYLPDYPGRASVKVDTGNTGDYRLNPAEASAYHQNLRRLADLLLAQPTLSRPRGINIEGVIGAHPIGSFMNHPPAPSAPVPGSGQFYYQDCLEIDGKPA